MGHTSVLGVLLSAGVGVFLLEFTLGARLRETSYDWLFALRPTVPVAEAFIVNLDEQSHVELKQPMNAAWDRDLADDLVGGKMALYSFAANLKVVKTEQDMLGTLFDDRA